MIQQRKGFTTIEISVTLLIIMIIFSLGGVSYKFYNNYKTEIVEKEFLNNLYSLINISRDICIERELSGSLRFEADKKRVIFEIGGKIDSKKTIKIPEEIVYDYSLNQMVIKSNGDLPACTVRWKGNKTNTNYKLTIQVGISTIRVYINEKLQEW